MELGQLHILRLAAVVSRSREQRLSVVPAYHMFLPQMWRYGPCIHLSCCAMRRRRGRAQRTLAGALDRWLRWLAQPMRPPCWLAWPCLARRPEWRAGREAGLVDTLQLLLLQ